LRTPTRRRAAFAATFTALALTAAACGSDDNGSGSDTTEASENGGSGGGDLTGSVNLDGSSTVGPLSEVAAELFMDENSGVRVTVAISGTGGGFQKFCIGENDMNNASRPIKPSEIDLCGENSIAYEGVQVANDALALIVHPNNPVACLSVAQANQIWDEGSTVATWADVEGLDLPADFLALPGGDVNRALGRQLYGPGTDSGTFDFFTEVINGESGKIRTDYIDIGEDDNAAVTAVSGVPHAMGYIPYSYFTEVGGAVKGIAIDGGAGCVDPTLDNVLNGTYVPMGRPLFTYASDVALAKPEVLAFMNYWIENSEEIAQVAGFVPMTDAQIAESQRKIQSLVGG
jgi:phosphate transport system substrate-binding protein